MNKGIRFTDEFKQDAVAQVVERGYASRCDGSRRSKLQRSCRDVTFDHQTDAAYR
jgi:transposase-like protein